MLPLKQWLDLPETKRIRNENAGDRFGREFFRDPMRPVFCCPDRFYAPADGIILYAHSRIKPDEPVVTVKGRPLTVKEILDNKDFSQECVSIGIYMTELDVHVNRVPTAGYLVEEHVTPYLFTHNFSMMLEQEDLLDKQHSDTADMGYMFPNERCVVKCYAPKIKKSYYIIQVAERDVDEIANWGLECQQQSERYGMVRFGSQVDIIIPLEKDEDRFRVLAKKDWHVTAGVDPIVEVTKGWNPFERLSR